MNQPRYYRNKVNIVIVLSIIYVGLLVLFVGLIVLMNKNKAIEYSKAKKVLGKEISQLDYDIVDAKRKLDQLMDSARVMPKLESMQSPLKRIDPKDDHVIYLPDVKNNDLKKNINEGGAK
jgi:hypothetical protein